MEPATNTGAAVAVATGAISLTGAVFGLQFDGLLFGLFGGLISLMHLPPMTTKRMAGSLAVSALMGAMFSPLAYVAAVTYFAWIKLIPADPVRLTFACAVGIVAQVAIPAVLTLIRRRGDTA